MLAALVGAVLSISAAIDQPPPAPREFRGVWVATVDHIDWPPRNVTDVDKQKQRLQEIIEKAASLHLNAVIFQVRPMGDALYKSDLEPWSEFLTGTQGKAPSPEWDPLEFAVKEAHSLGLELHAWVNPYRVWHPAAKSKPAANYIGYTHPMWTKDYGKLVWMDPGEPGVKEWSQKVIMDIVNRYDIDGLHLDDYFYPYPEKGMPFPDDHSFAAYQQKGGTLSREDWRRRNVDDFVSGLYKQIKARKPWVKFGISPFGIYRPGTPAGIKSGVDQYVDLSSDPLKWLQKGWVDYLAPQLYWPIAQKAQSYPVLAAWWGQQNTLHRALWLGNYASGVSARWDPSELLNQIKVTRETPGASGNILFSMSPFMKDSKGIDGSLLQGPYAEPALIPAMTWLKNSDPKRPYASVSGGAQGRTLHLKRESQDTFEWVIYLKQGNQWNLSRVMPAADGAMSLAQFGQGVSEIAVSAIDRYGNESGRVVAQFK
jgi:uncharacterized lipoprotein YddW (UPF0748 family)